MQAQSPMYLLRLCVDQLWVHLVRPTKEARQDSQKDCACVDSNLHYQV